MAMAFSLYFSDCQAYKDGVLQAELTCSAAAQLFMGMDAIMITVAWLLALTAVAVVTTDIFPPNDYRVDLIALICIAITFFIVLFWKRRCVTPIDKPR